MDAGIDLKGFVVVHEAPMGLPAPAQERVSHLPQISDQFKTALSTASKTVLPALGIALLAASQIAVIAVAGMAMGLATLDPILVVVTEDDYWVEIDRWWD